jgi:hypothetical protein
VKTRSRPAVFPAILLERPEIAGFQSEIENIPRLRVWTDDFSNLFRILK